MTYSNDPADNHSQICHRFIQQAEEQLANGNLAQASGKVWEAVSNSVTEIAKKRNWRCNSMMDLSVAVDRLAEETDDPKEELSMWFSFSVTSYINSSDDYKPENFVRLDIESAKKLLATLDDIESASV